MDNEQLDDGSNGSHKSNDKVITEKDIVLRQYQRCISASSQEMKPGYYVYSETIQNQKIKYFGDTRSILIRCINTFMDILDPKWEPRLNAKQKDFIAKYKTLNDIKARVDTLDKEYETKNTTNTNDEVYFRKKLKEYRLLFQICCWFMSKDLNKSADTNYRDHDANIKDHDVDDINTDSEALDKEGELI
jgi:hypothetical protein